MSGSIFDELKKNDQNKKRDKLKFFVAIASTNLLVAVATYALISDSSGHTAIHAVTRVLHPHHKMIISPLTLLVENNNNNVAEVPITLMNKAKKVLVHRAYLHEEIRSSGGERGPARFKIEIPEDELINLSADEQEIMIAMPELKTEPAKKPVKQRVSKYEINL